MDPFRFTTIAHSGLAILVPVASDALDRALAALPLGAEPRVLDAGCGKGEALVRLASRRGVRGVGVDPNAAFLEAARARAGAAGVSDRLEFHAVPMRDHAVPPGAFDAALCVGATHAFGTLADTLGSLARLVRPGGSLLVGEAYWKREPDPGYLAALGARREDYTFRDGHASLAASLGLAARESHASSDDEWDDYETRYAANVERWCAAHPGDPDAVAFLDRIREWQHVYRRWGRDTLGFALTRFERPEARA